MRRERGINKVHSDLLIGLVLIDFKLAAVPRVVHMKIEAYVFLSHRAPSPTNTNTHARTRARAQSHACACARAHTHTHTHSVPPTLSSLAAVVAFMYSSHVLHLLAHYYTTTTHLLTHTRAHTHTHTPTHTHPVFPNVQLLRSGCCIDVLSHVLGAVSVCMSVSVSAGMCHCGRVVWSQ